MPVANLRLRIISRWEGEDEAATNRVREGQLQLNIGFGRIGSALGRRGGIRRTMIKGAVLMAPALFILGKHLLGVVGGLAVMGAVVTAAALPWVALALTAARNSSEMGAAGARFHHGLARVESAWMDLARRTAPLTLGPVTDVLNGIAAAIPKLEPLVREVAPDFAQMGRDIGNWLSGNGFERFLQNINDYGVPAFRNLVNAGRDFMATVGIGFRQFLPLARDIANTLQAGARDLNANARRGGIARWMQDWRRNAPTANRFLREAAETLGIMAQLLDDLGTGTLGAVDAGLSALNAVNPYTLLAIALAWSSGRAIVGLAAALRMMQALRALRRVSFVAAVALLGESTALLNGAAAVLTGMAAAINNLARMVAANARVRVDSSALDRIKEIWDGIPKNGGADFTGAGFDLAVVAAAGVLSTFFAVQSAISVAAVFQARVDAGLFNGVMGLTLAAWAAVRAVGLAAPVFTATAVNAATLGMNAIIVNWSRVRAMATVPVIFTAMASPGNVPGVASTIIAAWARVRAAAAFRPIFTATANAGNVVSASAQIVAAWRRVAGMPKSWSATAQVSVGNVPGASNAIVAAWRRVLAMARSWHGVATCSFSGGFSGISGGSATYRAPSADLFVTFQPAPFIPFRPPTPSFPSPLGGPNGPQPGGTVGPPAPGDFEGGFGNAKGGPTGYSTIDRRPLGKGRGGDSRVIHIYEDVWVRDERELADLLKAAMN